MGCPGSRADSRCTFNEFCEYIWKAKKGETITRPTVTVLGDAEVFWDVPISQLYNRIVIWKDPVTSFGITGATDSSRVVLGSTDYYNALSRVSGPIGDLANMDLSGDQQALANKLVPNGRNSAQLLHDMRMQDL